jgi:hypothetical protein
MQTPQLEKCEPYGTRAAVHQNTLAGLYLGDPVETLVGCQIAEHQSFCFGSIDGIGHHNEPLGRMAKVRGITARLGKVSDTLAHREPADTST